MNIRQFSPFSKLISAISTIGFLGLIVFSSSVLNSCDSPSAKNSPKPSVILSATEARFLKDDTAMHYSIDLRYPSIDGDLRPEIINQINNTIADTFYLLSNQKEFIESHQNLPDEFYSYSTDIAGVLQNSYLLHQSGNYLHLVFSFYQYYLGSAHGSTHNQSLHFDLKTGQLVGFEDIFKTDSISISGLKTIINSNVPDSMCWGIQADSAVIPLMENYTFTSDSLILRIDDYALCPFAFGVTKIGIEKELFHPFMLDTTNYYSIEISPVMPEGEIATH